MIRRVQGHIIKLCVFVVMGYASGAYAEVTADPVKLMREVQEYASPGDESVKMQMTLMDRDGKVSQRSAAYTRKRRSAEHVASMKLIRFDAPAEMDGSGVLTLENDHEPDDQWMYLPAFHASRKIPSSNRSERYMGTEFFFEDVSEDKIELYRYTLLGYEERDGRRMAKVEQVPVDETVQRDSAYGKKVQWVDPERLLVAQVDYFDKIGKLIKRFHASGATDEAGKWRWSKSSMSDLRIGHRTDIVYSNRTIDSGVSPRTFTVRYLERGR